MTKRQRDADPIGRFCALTHISCFNVTVCIHQQPNVSYLNWHGHKYEFQRWPNAMSNLSHERNAFRHSI